MPTCLQAKSTTIVAIVNSLTTFSVHEGKTRRDLQKGNTMIMPTTTDTSTAALLLSKQLISRGIEEL